MPHTKSRLLILRPREVSVMQHLTSKNFSAETGRGSLPVVVMFYAVWCGKCAMMKPMIEEIEKNTGDASNSAKQRSTNPLCSPPITKPIPSQPSSFSNADIVSVPCTGSLMKAYSNSVYKKSLEIVKAYFICKCCRMCYIM